MSRGEDLSQTNREWFDKWATTAFDQDWVKELSQQITDNLRRRVDWLGFRKVTPNEADKPVRLLDYACGSGLASRALFPFVNELRGIDVSGKMVELYNKQASSEDLKPTRMHAIQGDVTIPLPEARDRAIGSLDFYDFNVAVISMALHHVEKPDILIKKLVDRLKVGGVLVIIDWVPDGFSARHASHPAAHTVAFDGFTREQMGHWLTEAGCSEWDYVELDERSKVPYNVSQIEYKQGFFARGRKGGE